MRSSNSLVAVDFLDECFPDVDDDFFFEVDFVASAALFKLSIRSSIDFAFFVVESFVVVVDTVGVKLDARVVRALMSFLIFSFAVLNASRS
jgi:hypothetical protein